MRIKFMNFRVLRYTIKFQQHLKKLLKQVVLKHYCILINLANRARGHFQATQEVIF